MTLDTKQCPLCHSAASAAGRKLGRRTGRAFALSRCNGCGFAWVDEPWTDDAAIYDEAYYSGRGSDPSVDYAFEYENPQQTIRSAEWRGLNRIITTLEPKAKRWLDFGCGNGGLVRYVAANSKINICGFDTGAWAARARQDGIPILEEATLANMQGQFDVITAIEVIEHVVEPVPFLRQLRSLLRPGGLLFITTGNAACVKNNFKSWRYVAPEVHVSYFTPKALGLALSAAGFRAEYHGFVAGFEDVIRFKTLKNIGSRRNSWWQNLVPWSLAIRFIDQRYGVTKLPTGRAV